MLNPTQQKMQALGSRLRECSRAYYAGTPEISDQEFDQLMRELLQLEAQHPEFRAADSPTRAINQTLPPGVSGTAHAAPMLSLDNLTSEEDVRGFVRSVLDHARKNGIPLDGVALVIEPKIDGLSASCTYQHGRLVRVLTRGNGQQGEDITANARMMHDIPEQLEPSSLADLPSLEIRGEIYMRPSVLAELNEQRAQEGETAYANTRNCAVGSIKLSNAVESQRRKLSFLAYDLVCNDITYEASGDPVPWIQRAGVPVVGRVHTLQLSRLTDLEECTMHLTRALAEFDARRRLSDMDTDGAVLKLVGSMALRQSLGHNGKFPHWAAAYKFAPEEASTILESVTFQIGKHGTVTPVAELRPVKLAGSVVQRATLHNRTYLDNLQLRAGCTVVISKAGEIIPQVVRRANEGPSEATVISMPKVCPACGGPLVNEEEAVAVRCTNWNCKGSAATPGTVVARLRHAVGKEALNVDGVGESLIQGLVFDCGVTRVSQLFQLDPARLMTGLTVPFETALRYINMFKNAAAAQLKSPERVLYALSILNLGRKACRALAAHYGSVRDMMQCDETVIRSTPDLAPVAAAAWLSVREAEWFKQEIDQLEVIGFDMRMPPPSVSSNKLAGQTWVITGELHDPRESYEAVIRSHGGRVTGSVSGKTTGLLVGTNPGNNKLKGAAKHNVKQYNEQEFWQLLEK
jgi:DNA ligase (NAD+)